MANYIHSLQAQVEMQKQAIERAQASIELMMLHINSDKYLGYNSDGSRKDWIATGDVFEFLRGLRSELSQ